MAHRVYVGGVFGQSGWCSGGIGSLNLDVDVGVVFFELFCP